MSFWIVSRSPTCAAVVSSPGWPKASFAVRLSPAMKALTRARPVSSRPCALRPVDLLDGGRGSEPVDPLVQVHDEQVETVRAAAPRGDEAHDLGASDPIFPEIRQGLEDRLQARLQRRRGVRPPHLDRLDHRREIVGDSLRQELCARGEKRLGVDTARARNGGAECGTVQPHAPNFALHRRRGPARLGSLSASFLQHRQTDLEPVVGRQRLFDQRGKQDGALAQFFDDLDLSDHFWPSNSLCPESCVDPPAHESLRGFRIAAPIPVHLEH